MRIFLYVSNPYEESFEFEDQVADYHTEVSHSSLHFNSNLFILSSIYFYLWNNVHSVRM